jgi:succinate dehydrogenase/fumarate reductase cytochrome b subunit
VVPLAVYTVVHVASYAGALFGSARFGVEASTEPAWLAFELALVWFPLAFHVAYGLSLFTTPLPSERPERQRGILLRASGLGALPFIVGHSLWLRAPLWRGTRSPDDIQQMLAAGLSSTVRGFPLSAALHCLGLGAVALHLALGLAAFAEKWGLLAQSPARRAANLFSLALFLVGGATVIELATGSLLPRFTR